MSLTNIEFFAYEGEVWYQSSDGSIEKLQESNSEIIDELIDHIATFYPKAHNALCSEYKGCALNRSYYRYRIVSRFIRCNFAKLDNIPDFSPNCRCSFEFVPCPLRGECRHERVICRPEFDHKLSAAEMPVLRLWFNALSIDDIADRLCLSPHTVNNHIRHAYQRLNIHSRAEFVRYASQNHLFS
ncbi:MAG: helix-turn-helix transcriptional regulator [Muribaculaceae bacterium]|uniref:helix-turn-helix domain-containing protein n=1 Tax=Duncaniella sp. TaxID=2518496 RepID=UPI0023C772C7|nr:helix-turn-helix transcriptional regulator [Muribaculaceae bacterium]MDE5988918.1 helix-turn-helix transcriptional regulator [Duncaniella sp.]